MKKATKKKPITLAALKKKLEPLFNAHIRQRDSAGGYFTCISCGQTKPVEQMNAGHYVPVKGGDYLRFHEWNVNGECIGCNWHDQFHLIGYRKNLIAKIGEDAVKWLEDNRHTVKKWTRQELLDLIETYKQPKQNKAA